MTQIAFTRTNLANINKAIADGVRKVTTSDGKSVEYASMGELIALRDRMIREIDFAENGAEGATPMTRRAQFTRD